MQEDLQKQAHAYEEKKRSLKHKVRNARADLQTSQTLEQNLVQKLDKMESDLKS